ncbi:MAG TPA: amino acid permease, partial [Bacilli bacterium]
FESLEDLFAVLKIAAIVMFMGIAAAAIAGLIDGGKNPIHFPHTVDTFFTTGAAGLWSSLIFAFYAFGGIEIMGLMAMRLREPKKAPMAGKVMILTLASIYVLSLGLAISMVSWRAFNTKESPFVVALDNYHLAFVPHVFNAVLIIAGFSTMVASLYAVTTMVVTLAGDRDAPVFFTLLKHGGTMYPFRP